MINNNSGNKSKNITFYRPMYILFNTNTGQCIFFIDLFLSLIEVNVYFLLTFFIINLVLVLKKYTLTCINDKKINKKYTLTCIIVVFFSSIVCEVNKTVFFFIKHILNLKYTNQ